MLYWNNHPYVDAWIENKFNKNRCCIEIGEDDIKNIQDICLIKTDVVLKWIYTSKH